MPLEVTSLCEGVVALFANERLFTTVNQHVAFQLRSTIGLVTTLAASVGLCYIMLLMHMCLQVPLRLESDIALNTFVFIRHFHHFVRILIV